MNYTFERAITTTHGMAIYATALSAVNFTLAQQLANHKDLKMPTVKVDSPDDLRDPMQMPELEGRTADPITLDIIANGLIASASLMNSLSYFEDYDPATGRHTMPYSYLRDRIQTPFKAVQRQYEWRDDMASKAAQEQALILGIKDTNDIGKKAKERSKAQNKERMDYALTELQSVCQYSLQDEAQNKLQEMLIDLDGKCYNGLLITSNLANASMANARKRLTAGLYAFVDNELALFAKATVKDDQPD